MSNLDNPLSTRSFLVLRAGLAVSLWAHGFGRLLHGTVPNFGVYLNEAGIPFGKGVAWMITLLEVVGPLCILLGRHIRWVVPGHLVVLVAGIVMIHGREGWYVVGGGRNGMEFSFSLIVSLTALWLAAPSLGLWRRLRPE